MALSILACAMTRQQTEYRTITPEVLHKHDAYNFSCLQGNKVAPCRLLNAILLI